VARVFIDTGELEAAIAVREAVEADGHEAEMVETARELESRRREGEEEVALVLTSAPEEDRAVRMRRLFDELIPRPPIVAIVQAGGEGLAELTAAHDLDACLHAPPDPDEVQVVLSQELDRYRVQLETGIIGRTRAVRDVLERIHLIAPVNSTVLLTGESGTGKELVARAIHRYSRRRGKPFIAVNCAALPESLLESELFGHEKGAFTGATSRRQGMFELADEGTILLDEVAEMPPPTQTRLLRVLEQRRFMRVGGHQEIEVDVRVITATNRDLAGAVQAGSFRRDLYYRLNVLHMELPPLRERRSDIPILVRRFVREFTEVHDREFKGLTPEAMGILLEYDWPGNVRELRNLVESMVVLAPGSTIRAEDIPTEIRRGHGRAMLPVWAGGGSRETSLVAGEPGTQLPEMEFIFHTLIDLKMDVEDLRREFERYRDAHPELISEISGRGLEIEIPATVERSEVEESEGLEGSTIRFRPGMTMSELEREAIIATLRAVDGNRRKAAEKLGIGERTLYRKLREYEVDL
jgi:DNA-binding NtrC family response regulator